MSVADECKSWFEFFQQVIGLSPEQSFALSALTLPAAWNWSVVESASDQGSPTKSPLTCTASLMRWAGLHGDWALHAHDWLHSRPALYLPLLVSAAVLTAIGHSKALDGRLATLGLAVVPYLAAFEIRNSPATLIAYLGVSVVPCIAAILVDRWFRSERYRSYPALSVAYWMQAIVLVSFGALVLPPIVVARVVASYRIESSSDDHPPPTGARICSSE